MVRRQQKSCWVNGYSCVGRRDVLLSQGRGQLLCRHHALTTSKACSDASIISPACSGSRERQRDKRRRRPFACMPSNISSQPRRTRGRKPRAASFISPATAVGSVFSKNWHFCPENALRPPFSRGSGHILPLS